jgi:hypothetical protein
LAAHGVGAADAWRDAQRHCSKQLIADQMSEGIVDVFEMIQIDE